MAGRHRKPPAWRRLLSALFRDRHAARTAALQAEVRKLRATVAELRRDLELARAEAAAARLSQSRWLTIPMADAAVPVDRGEDVAVTEIVLADLPESALLDPKVRPGDDVAIDVASAPKPVADGRAAKDRAVA